MQWYRSEQLRLFQIECSSLYLLYCSYCTLYLGEKNAAVLRQKFNSALGHWFVFIHIVTLARWIDLGSTTHNTNCSIAWQRSVCHHTPVLSLLMHSPNALVVFGNPCECRGTSTGATLCDKHNFKPFTVLLPVSCSVMLNVIHTEETNQGRFTQKSEGNTYLAEAVFES